MKADLDRATEYERVSEDCMELAANEGDENKRMELLRLANTWLEAAVKMRAQCLQPDTSIFQHPGTSNLGAAFRPHASEEDKQGSSPEKAPH